MTIDTTCAADETADGEPSDQQYDAVAEDYDRLIRPRYDAIAALVVDRVRELTDVGRADVVEISAGTGALTHQLAPLARSYLATDISEPMMAVARQRALPGTEHVTWRRADVRNLPLDSATADVVVSSLGPFQDSAVALDETRRVLRSHGVLAAVTWGDDYRELALLQEVRRRVGLPPRATTTSAELADRLAQAGYRAVSVTDVRMPVIHVTVPAYLDYRRAFGPVPDLRTTDPDDLLRALTACAAEYTDDQGRVVLDWHLLVLSAVR